MQSNFTRRTSRSLLLLSTAIVASIAATAVSAAEIVVVTGSRIPSPNLTSVSPIATVSADYLEKTGVQNLDVALNQLPELVADVGESTNNGGGGASFANLRGLSFERTLVLVNGRRFVPAAIGGQVDLNEIPQAMIERVDIVTGGASAVYGSDAIAGVVNVILKKDFEGINANGEIGVSDKGDGDNHSLSLVVGSNAPNGKGNVTLYAQYYTQTPIFRSARGISAIDLASATTGWTKITGLGVTAANDALAQTSLNSLFTGYGAPAGDFPDTAHFGINNNGTLFGYATDGTTPTNNFHRLDEVPSQVGCPNDGSGTADIPSTECFQNIANQNYLIVPTKRIGLGASAHYEVLPGVTLFADLNFQNWVNGFALASNPVVGIRVPVTAAGVAGTDLATVLASRGAESNQVFVVRRRFTELGPRTEVFDTSAFNVTVGLNGTWLQNSWTWEAYYADQRNYGFANQSGIVNADRLADALGSPRIGSTIFNGGGNVGVAPCSSGNADCVPINILGTGSISPGAAAYINAKAQANNSLTQHIVAGDTEGSLGIDPFGAGAISASLGFEYREQSFNQQGDVNLTPTTADPSSCPTNGLNCVLPIQASQNVKEYFGEARVPLVKDLPYAKEVNLTVGYRYSQYSNRVSTNAYKIGADWSVLDTLRVRGGYQRAVRAPTILDTNGPTLQNFPLFDGATDDFCSQNFVGGAPNAATQAFCASQGVVSPSTFVNSQNQPGTGSFDTANPKLKAEVADTYNVGFTVSGEDFLPGFVGSLDYYNIELNKQIQFASPQAIFAECARTLNASDPFCAAIQRDPGTNGGEVDIFIRPKLNLGSLKTSGLDLNASYVSDLSDLDLPDWGQVGLDLYATYLLEYDVDNAPGALPVQHVVGTTGNTNITGSVVGNTFPRFRSNLRLNYNVADFSVQLAWRLLTSVTDAVDPTVKTGTFNYLDTRASYQFNDQINFYFGINNLTEVAPPRLPSAFNSNTDGSTYDVIGRFYFTGITFKN